MRSCQLDVFYGEFLPLALQTKGGFQQDLARIYSVFTVSFLPLRESTLLLHTRCVLSFVILSNLWSKKRGMEGMVEKNLCVNLPESASEMRRKIDCKPQCAHTVDVGK